MSKKDRSNRSTEYAVMNMSKRPNFIYMAGMICSGQLIPDSDLGFSSATAGAIPPL